MKVTAIRLLLILSLVSIQCTPERSVAVQPLPCPSAPQQPVMDLRPNTTLHTAGSCVLTGKMLAVHAIVPTHWTFDEGTAKALGRKSQDGRQLWSFSCNLPDGNCYRAVVVDLEEADRSGDVRWKDVTLPVGMKIVTRTGSVLVLQFGPMRTLTVDIADGKVSYRESGPTTEGRGEARCTNTL